MTQERPKLIVAVVYYVEGLNEIGRGFKYRLILCSVHLLMMTSFVVSMGWNENLSVVFLPTQSNGREISENGAACRNSRQQHL